MRLGTRGSALALAQSRSVADLLGGGVELVVVESSGSALDDKSRWTKALDEALLKGEVDLALHSAKDVPAERPDGIATVGVPVREDPRDAICGAASLDALVPGASVGTSSPRRKALIEALRDDLRVVELRGNIDTRLRKLDEGACDALVLAVAGLNRLGLADRGSPIDGHSMIPAAGQGALLLEGRDGDAAARAAGEAITDSAAHNELLAERTVIEALDADCHTAVGVLARSEGPGMSLKAVVLALDGSRQLVAEARGDAGDPVAVGRAAAKQLLDGGAEELLAIARGELN